MSTNVVSVSADDTLDKVFDLIEASRISGVPVRDGSGEFVGVLTKTDLVSHKLVEGIRAHHELASLKVRDFMCPHPPITIRDNETIEAAIEKMTYKHIHRLFVVDAQGNMVGVISTFDVVKLMSQVFKAYL